MSVTAHGAHHQLAGRRVTRAALLWTAVAVVVALGWAVAGTRLRRVLRPDTPPSGSLATGPGPVVDITGTTAVDVREALRPVSPLPVAADEHDPSDPVA